MLFNYHTHSRYCDGKGELREYVEYALSRGFVSLGFSGHAPVPFPSTFAIKDDEYINYCNEVRQLQQEYKGRIDIKLGLEIDYIPGLQEDFKPLVEKGGLDYVIGGVHLLTNPADVDSLRHMLTEQSERDDVRKQIPYKLWFIDGPRQETYDNGLHHIFHDDIRAGVKAYFNQQCSMIEQNHPTIVAHPDKIVMHNRERYFKSDEKWYRDLLFETLHLIKESGCICEINTRGLYKGRHIDYYPSKEAIRYMNSLNIPVLVGTDAHQPTDLDRFEGAYDFLKEIGYRQIVTSI